jgi:hypothetical protein
MKRRFRLAPLGGLLLCATVAAAAPVTTFFSNQMNPHSGLRGLHINRSSADRTPHGISLDMDGVPLWDLGIDYESADLVLAFSHTTRTDQIRLRPDTGQIDIGPIVGHPVTQSHLNITAGTPEHPLDGVGVGCWGNRAGLYIYQRLPGTLRTKIVLDNLFQIVTDSRQANVPDFSIYNSGTGRHALLISPTDQVTLGYGATIGRCLEHTGNALGFYGARPVARPRITGSRSDGTALANLLDKLEAMGLIVDNTTP